MKNILDTKIYLDKKFLKTEMEKDLKELKIDIVLGEKNNKKFNITNNNKLNIIILYFLVSITIGVYLVNFA